MVGEILAATEISVTASLSMVNINRGGGAATDESAINAIGPDVGTMVTASGAADRVRDHWRGNWGKDDFPFHDGWKGGHWHGDHDHWNHWGYWDHWHGHDSWFWWGWATAPLLTSWLNYGWGTPYYWDYGPGEYINCYDDVIYANGLWYQPVPVYYDTATAIAERRPTGPRNRLSKSNGCR